MLTDHLITLFNRDLLKLKAEIAAYTKEENLWVISARINNSGGNLCLHLLGNLQHYIGHILGGTDYLRDRPSEFSRKNVPRDEMIGEIERTRKIVTETIAALPMLSLAEMYPEKVFENETSTEFFLIHLQGHLNYHLGQVNYHRRLLDNG